MSNRRWIQIALVYPYGTKTAAEAYLTLEALTRLGHEVRVITENSAMRFLARRIK